MKYMAFLSIGKAIKMALNYQALVIYTREGFPELEIVLGVEAEDSGGTVVFRVKSQGQGISCTK